MPSDKSQRSTLGGEIFVINVGLEKFAVELSEQNVPVIQVDWKPPAGGDTELAALLSKMGL
ncbi:MAG: hypothetical protein CMM52_14510 [Rhodospirillaceae bacterium]|nr:hypothetical protein [Rhodospirillaceae bacterium]|tara:strand:- start:26597 stop:26779 length:183 start_codon:yes stop_codon:yes gene_type:complete